MESVDPSGLEAEVAPVSASAGVSVLASVEVSGDVDGSLAPAVEESAAASVGAVELVCSVDASSGCGDSPSEVGSLEASLDASVGPVSPASPAVVLASVEPSVASGLLSSVDRGIVVGSALSPVGPSAVVEASEDASGGADVPSADSEGVDAPSVVSVVAISVEPSEVASEEASLASADAAVDSSDNGVVVDSSGAGVVEAEESDVDISPSVLAAISVDSVEASDDAVVDSVEPSVADGVAVLSGPVAPSLGAAVV